MALQTIDCCQMLNDAILDSIYLDEQPSLALHTATLGATQRNNLYTYNAQRVLAYNRQYQARFPTHTPILWAASHHLQASSLSNIEYQATNFVALLSQVPIPTMLVITIATQDRRLPTFADVQLFIESVNSLFWTYHQCVRPPMIIKGSRSNLNQIFYWKNNLNTALWLEKTNTNQEVSCPDAWAHYTILEYENSLHDFNQAVTTAPVFIQHLYDLSYRGHCQATIFTQNNLFTLSPAL